VQLFLITTGEAYLAHLSRKIIIMAARKKTAIWKLENNQVSKNNSRGGRNYVKTGVGHGGTRRGSGRKEGACTRRTREIVEQLHKSGGITPLSYLLSVLRETPDDVKKQYESGIIDLIEYKVKMENITKRRDRTAVFLAPYIHPRLSAITANVTTPEHERFVKEREAVALLIMAEEAAKK